MSVVDLAPRDGVWTIPADDPLDLPHEICLDMLDETTMGLTLLLSGAGCLLSTSEARTIAAALLAAADYADACKVLPA